MAKPYVQPPPPRQTTPEKPDTKRRTSVKLTPPCAPTEETDERYKAMNERWLDTYGKEVKKQ